MEQKLKTADADKKRLKEWIKKILPNEWDKIDINAEYDGSLCYSENKELIRNKIRLLLRSNERNLKERVNEVKAEKEKLTHEAKLKAEEEVKDYNKRIYVENKELDEWFKPIDRVILKLIQGYSNLTFIKGRGGTGKSYRIRRALIKAYPDPNIYDTKVIEQSGDVTEAYLYRLFYENNGKIIWFKDVPKLLMGLKSLNLLKSATETEDKRLLTKGSYSRQQDDLPDSFLYKGKIIFDYNNLNGLALKDDFEALVTRGDFVDMTYSEDDMKAIMNLIAIKDWQKEVTEFLINNYKEAVILLNLRTQYKAFKTYDFAKRNNLDWKEEVLADLKSSVSKARNLLYTLVGNRAIKTKELKKRLLKYGIVGTIRTADNRIQEWLLTEEIFQVTPGERDFYVCLNQIEPKEVKRYME